MQNMNWIDELLNNYHRFLKEKTAVNKIPSTNWVEISTPFIDVFNDAIEIYAQQRNGKIILSDDVRKVRERQTDKKVTGLAVINDEKRDVKDEYLTGLQALNSDFILWSERHKPDNIKKLKAA